MSLPKIHDGTSRIGGRPADFFNAPQKELEPAFPIPILANSHQAVVIVSPMHLQKQAQVEKRPTQHLPFTQKERDEEPADTTVAVEERVNRLELSVGQPAVNQDGQAGVMQEFLEVVERRLHLVNGRWYEARSR